MIWSNRGIPQKCFAALNLLMILITSETNRLLIQYYLNVEISKEKKKYFTPYYVSKYNDYLPLKKTY